MAKFDLAIDIILAHEGGLSDNPSDPGGVTKYGISARSYPYLDIRNLTIEDAKKIYRTDYWEKIKGDLIDDQKIANQLLDFSVNSGVGQAVKSLQRALNKVVKPFPPLEIDGGMGPKTLTALNTGSSAKISNALVSERLAFYQEIIYKNPQLAVFENGWTRRATSFLLDNPATGISIAGLALGLFTLYALS
jgi:lysozyme family protein